MQKVIGVTELQKQFRSVFNDVAQDNHSYVLIRGSRAEAALIPYDSFQRFLAFQEQEMSLKFDRLAEQVAEYNAEYSDEEMAEDIEIAIKEAHHLVEKPDKLQNLIYRPDAITGDPEALVHMEWEYTLDLP